MAPNPNPFADDDNWVDDISISDYEDDNSGAVSNHVNGIASQGVDDVLGCSNDPRVTEDIQRRALVNNSGRNAAVTLPSLHPPSPGSGNSRWVEFLLTEIKTKTNDSLIRRLMKGLLIYLDPKSTKSAMSTAYYIYMLNDAFRKSRGYFSNDHDDNDSFLWLIWGGLLEIVARCHYKHDSLTLDKLVDLVQELIYLPKTPIYVSES
jgi:hypothetical protein